MENKIEYKFNVFPLSEEDGGGFYAEVPELHGCMASADTLEETMVLLEEAISSWIEVSSAKGKNIPKPSKFCIEEELPSGRFSVRIARSSHKKLLEIAEKENVSLNGLVAKLLDQMIMVQDAQKILEEKIEKICRAKTEIKIIDKRPGKWSFREKTLPVFFDNTSTNVIIPMDNGRGLRGA